MGKLTVSTFVTLDGVMEAPNEWQPRFFDDEAGLMAREGLFAADALLLGRRTYEHFASAWPTMTDEEGFADRMNAIPKFVASTTLEEATWNASVIDGDVPARIAELKAQQRLLVMGSHQLIETLREHDLVDAYEVWIHPVVVGEGARLFDPPNGSAALRLTGVRQTQPGIVVLSYERATE